MQIEGCGKQVRLEQPAAFYLPANDTNVYPLLSHDHKVAAALPGLGSVFQSGKNGKGRAEGKKNLSSSKMFVQERCSSYMLLDCPYLQGRVENETLN